MTGECEVPYTGPYSKLGVWVRWERLKDDCEAFVGRTAHARADDGRHSHGRLRGRELPPFDRPMDEPRILRPRARRVPVPMVSGVQGQGDPRWLHADGGEPDRVNRLSPDIPMLRGGTVDEVANSIVWLLSDKASYVTGTFIDIAGGK